MRRQSARWVAKQRIASDVEDTAWSPRGNGRGEPPDVLQSIPGSENLNGYAAGRSRLTVGVVSVSSAENAVQRGGFGRRSRGNRVGGGVEITHRYIEYINVNRA